MKDLMGSWRRWRRVVRRGGGAGNSGPVEARARRVSLGVSAQCRERAQSAAQALRMGAETERELSRLAVLGMSSVGVQAFRLEIGP